MSIRAFIAIEISKEIQQKIAELQERLQKSVRFLPLDINWVKPENIHITLKFLGNTEEKLIEKITGEMQAVAQSIKPFRLSVSGLGVFPSERQPRVFWAGIKDGKRELQQLQSQLEPKIIALGFCAEERAFHPHLTLARIKSIRSSASAFMKLVEDHQRFSELGNCEVNELVLFQSELHPSGAIYTPLKKNKFQK